MRDQHLLNRISAEQSEKNKSKIEKYHDLIRAIKTNANDRVSSLLGEKGRLDVNTRVCPTSAAFAEGGGNDNGETPLVWASYCGNVKGASVDLHSEKCIYFIC